MTTTEKTNSIKKTARTLEDVKIKLSALWAARMLSGLQGDSTRLHDPVALKELVAGTTEVPITNELLLAMSIIFKPLRGKVVITLEHNNRI